MKKRDFFNRFFATFILWLIGATGIVVGNLFVQWESGFTIFWIAYIALNLLGVYLVYQLYRFTTAKMSQVGNPFADMVLSVSLIMGFGVMVLIGILSDYLAGAALFLAPIYGIWNLYRYMTFET